MGVGGSARYILQTTFMLSLSTISGLSQPRFVKHGS